MTTATSFARQDNGTDAFATGAGVAQVGAQLLTGGVNTIISPTGQTAYRLPLNAAPGSPIVVSNSSTSSAAALVYPPLNNDGVTPNGGSIGSGAANAAFSVAAGKTALFYPLPAVTGSNVCSFVVVLSA